MRLMSFVVAALLVGSVPAYARQRSGGAAVLEAPKGTAAISGVVTDATTGKPIEGAMVSLGVTTGGSIILTLPRVTTDPKGRFLFRDLAPSTKYYIRAARVGYAPARFGAAGPRMPSDRISDTEIMTTDDIVTISVAADQWVGDLQVKLWRLGSITGRVVDERGEPVVGVAVRGFSSVPIAGHSQWAGSDLATTDDRGEYRLANLMPGKYVVSVLSVQQTVLDTTPEAAQRRAIGAISFGGGSNPGLPAIDVDGTHRIAISNFATPPPPSAMAPRAYAAQFYPGAPTLTSARTIDIGYGTSRRGVDFQLQPVPTVRVSGRLVSTEGGAGDALSMLLRLLPAGSEQLGVGSEAATTVVERDGSFTFLNVPAGDYTLLAQATFSEATRGAGEMQLPDTPGFTAGVGQAGMAMNLSGGLNYSSHSGKTSMWGRASVAVGNSHVTDLVVPM
ncbi:MAG: carboxypeptidase regulatory-like domain-containing protein, partial [Acidobacteriota bacterium]